MIEINKRERDFLLSKGCKWHHDIFASTTRRHYYAKESPWIKQKLEMFHKREKGE